jgi:hypothetical protein
LVDLMVNVMVNAFRSIGRCDADIVPVVPVRKKKVTHNVADPTVAGGK